MNFSYKNLWKILIDKGLKKKNLVEEVGIAPSTIAKMSKGESVSLTVLGKICSYLNCQIGDVVELVEETPE